MSSFRDSVDFAFILICYMRVQRRDFASAEAKILFQIPQFCGIMIPADFCKMHVKPTIGRIFTMAKELKGTKTEQNLLEAFAGESMARNKYTYFASKARKDGYVQIAELFEATAANEKEHAKMWFKLLEGGEIKDTAANLLHAAEGENAEWTDMYVRMAEEADAEGFPAIAHKFRMVAAIEKALGKGKHRVRLCIPYSDGAVLDMLHREAQIESTDYAAEGTVVEAVVDDKTCGRVSAYIIDNE